MSHSRLGKGLEVLFKQKNIDSSFVFEDKYQLIPINFIEPNPFQPRKEFDEESLSQLAASIKQQGLLQPIVVRTSPTDEKKFQIIAGERRWRACKMLNMETIPAVLLDVNDEELMLVALVENLQREDLNPIEEAEALYRAQKLLKVTHEELSQRLGKSRSSITNALRLLKLDEEIKIAIKDKKITAGQARPLLGIEEKEARLSLFKLIVDRNLSAREVEELVAFWKKHKKLPDSLNTLSKKPYRRRKTSKDFLEFKKTMQQKLKDFFNVPTKIFGDFEEGKIVIRYSSKQQLKSILKKFDLDL